MRDFKVAGSTVNKGKLFIKKCTNRLLYPNIILLALRELFIKAFVRKTRVVCVMPAIRRSLHSMSHYPVDDFIFYFIFIMILIIIYNIVIIISMTIYWRHNALE